MNEKNQNPQEPKKEEQAQPEQQQQAQEQKAPEGNVSSNAKTWSIVGYIFPILFFIPLVMEDLKNNKYAKFHANQQLVLLLVAIAVNIVGGIIPILGWFIILPLGSLAIIVLAVMGIINGVKEKAKPLPLIGGIEIIK
ncbi:MAG: hypothetical protein U5L10_01025 [Candidatus Moranbacteria bacterium]|nr:hypothetical protein [Candidatus Moranbacteria bacterium]